MRRARVVRVLVSELRLDMPPAFEKVSRQALYIDVVICTPCFDMTG